MSMKSIMLEVHSAMIFKLLKLFFSTHTGLLV